MSWKHLQKSKFFTHAFLKKLFLIKIFFYNPGAPSQTSTEGLVSDGRVIVIIDQMAVVAMQLVVVIFGEQTVDVSGWVYSQSLANKMSTRALGVLCIYSLE